jgi:hypothetical protein
VRYSEIGGSPVLWEPVTRVLHELTPAGAGLWASFDGRTLAEIVAGAAGSMAPDDRIRFEREAVEVVRRLRAVGLVEDLGDGSPPRDDGSTGVPPSVVRLLGRPAAVPTTDPDPGPPPIAVADAEADGVTVALASAVDAEGERVSAFVEVDVTTATLVAVIDPETGTRPDGRTVRALQIVLDACVDGRGEPTAPGPVVVLAALMAAVPADPEPHPLVLDALAGLAESVPGVAGIAGTRES